MSKSHRGVANEIFACIVPASSSSASSTAAPSSCDSPSMLNFLSSQNHSNGGNNSVSASVGNGLYKTYSESSSFSPSTVHDCYDDMELEQIVDDVDDMYREQSRRSRYDLCNLSSVGISANNFKTHDLLRRNAVAANGGGILSHLLNRSSQDIANEIARSLVDKALEKDRKKLVRGRYRLSGDKASQEEELIVENYIEVSVNRTLEAMVNELLDAQVNDVANTVYYGCGGKASELSRADTKTATDYLQIETEAILDLFTAAPTSGSTMTLSFGLHRSDEFKTTGDDYALNAADEELDEQMRELTNSGERWRGTRHACSEVCAQKRREREAAEEEAEAEAEKRPPAVAAAKQPSPPAKKEDERRKRNSLGILLSSLREKVYHCRCVDCQEERRAEGKPEPEVSIEVKELEMPDVPEDVQIVIPRTKKRGRPRIFPRLEDLLMHGRDRSTADADGGGEAQMPPPPSPTPKPLPVKRPRGRPRKHKIGQDSRPSPREGPTATVRESTDGKLLLTIKNHRSVIIPGRPRATGTKKKTKKRKRGRRKGRKRGRPRKRSETEDESEGEESEETTDDDDDDSDLDDEAFFRKFKSNGGEDRVPHERPTRVSAGRNLKRFLDMEECDMEGEDEEEEDDESLFVPMKTAPAAPAESKLELQRDKGSRPPAKRRPGRPRKYPLPPLPPLPTYHLENAPSPKKQSGAEMAAVASATATRDSPTAQKLNEDADVHSLLTPRCENASALSEEGSSSTACFSPSVLGNGGRTVRAGPSIVSSGGGGGGGRATPHPLPIPPGVGGGGGGGGVGHGRRLTRSSSSPSSSPSKRWSELHEEQLPFAMVDDEPDADADQDHVHPLFHLKREESGGGGGGFVMDFNGNKADRRKLDCSSGVGGGGDEGERNENTLVAPSAHLRTAELRGRRSVSSEIATMRPPLGRMATSPPPHLLCKWGEGAKSVGLNEKFHCCDGQKNGSSPDTPPPWSSSKASKDIDESSSQIGSDGSVGGSCSGGSEERYAYVCDSVNAASEAGAKVFPACRIAPDNPNRSDKCPDATAGHRDPISRSGGEVRFTPLQATASTTNVPEVSSAEGKTGKVETTEPGAALPREGFSKVGERSAGNHEARRTFRLHSGESASKLIDRLSGIVKQLNAKLGQSRREKRGGEVEDKGKEDEEGNAHRRDKKPPPVSEEFAVEPFPGNAIATARRLQRQVDPRGPTTGERKGEKALFPGAVPTTTTTVFSPRGRGENGACSSSPPPSTHSHSSLSPEECQEREKGNETDSDSVGGGGGGGNSDFVSMRDSNRLPSSAAPSRPSLLQGPGYDNEVEEEGRGGNGLRLRGGERRGEPFEMRSKLGRRGAESRIRAAAAEAEGATEGGRGQGRWRMRMDERKAAREREEEEEEEDDDDEEEEEEADLLFEGRRVTDKYDDDEDADNVAVAANTGGAGEPGVATERAWHEPGTVVKDLFLLVEKEARNALRGNREPRPSSLQKRPPPLLPDAPPSDSVLYSLPGWCGIRLGSSSAVDRDRALVDGDNSVISSVSDISMLATSGQKG